MRLEYRCKQCGLQDFNRNSIFHHSCFENMIEIRDRREEGNRKGIEWRPYVPA